MNNLLKKEVYIPIEIKPREFVSQLLLSSELAKQGLRVYLGSKKAVDNLIFNKTKSTGVYLYKGGGGSINKFRNISKKVESIAVLDQEISPALIDYRIIKNRFVSGCLRYVSRLYYIGNEAKNKAIEILEDIESSKIKSFGWPRVDLWKPNMHNIWTDQIKDIKERFPEPFILFTSDFGCNTENLVRDISLRMEKRCAKKTKKEINWYKKVYLNEYKTFLQFVDFLSLINEDPDIPNIVIRPHPNEDHSAWEEKVKGLSKVYVVYEGDVSPWLLASEGLIHRGCTSAIEGAISRKKIGFLQNFSSDHNKALPALISPKITDIRTLKEWINSEQEFIEESSYHQNLLKKHISIPNEKSASLIAQDLASLSKKLISPSHISNNYRKPTLKESIVNVIEILSKLLKLPFIFLNKVYVRPNYIPKFYKKNKMQNGIKLSECNYFLSIMSPDISYNLMEISPNLIKIEISN